MEPEITFLLMGKTGHGKSATGNMILNRKQYFKSSSDDRSQTKEVLSGFAKFGRYTLLVVDGPGVADTDKNDVQDKQTLAQSMATAISLCHGYVDAFLLVIKFGTRCTTEEKSALEDLKRIFGDKYLSHLIVVMTCGDSFLGTMEEEGRNLTFHGWCREQTGDIKQLFEDCDSRFVLFNNREKDEEKKQEQIQEIVRLALSLRNTCGRYTSKCFEEAENERQRRIIELKAPHLTLEIQKKISLLTAEIDEFSKQPAGTCSANIRARIQDLKQEITVQDKGFGVLNHLMVLVGKVEENLSDVTQLQNLSKELETARRAHTCSSSLGSLATSIGAALTFVIPPVGVGILLGGAAANAFSRMLHTSHARAIEAKQETIKNKMKHDPGYQTKNH